IEEMKKANGAIYEVIPFEKELETHPDFVGRQWLFEEIDERLRLPNDNRCLFNNDEELFERERNRLGGLLLLKGKDNISSNNEPYSRKLKSYANTLYWNETLREDAYKSKKDFLNMIATLGLNFHAMPSFGPDELEERHKLLFDLATIIWK
ncbi:MAG: DUF1524 domain-containing protein, partial [Hymenobacter sp.]